MTQVPPPLVTPSVDLPAAALSERVYARIRQLILDFVLLPGDRFSESDLANLVQVSRTPLRQALQRLQREGWLRVFPKVGWQVSPLDFEALDQLYELRTLLEVHAVGCLCQAESRPVLDELAPVWLAPEAERQRNLLTVDRLDEAFHTGLVRAAGNPEMTRVHADVTERTRILRRLDFTKPQRIEATYDEHAQILRAISRRRTDEAQRLLRAHIAHSRIEAQHITLEMLHNARERLAEAQTR